MPWGSRLLCLWPGLARLWLRGDGYSLVLAVFYSILLNLVIVSSLIWPDYLGSRFPQFAWPLLIAVWAISFWVSWRSLPQLLDVGKRVVVATDTRLDTLFIHSQREYLKGNWVEAQRLLEQRLRLRPRDVESRLLLVCVFRQVNRLEAALAELELLDGMDEARPWGFEISREREQILGILESADDEGGSAQELRDPSSSLANDSQVTDFDSQAPGQQPEEHRRAA